MISLVVSWPELAGIDDVIILVARGKGRKIFFFQKWTHYIPLERKFQAD